MFLTECACGGSTRMVFLTNEELLTKAKNHEAVNQRLHSDRGEVLRRTRTALLAMSKAKLG